MIYRIVYNLIHNGRVVMETYTYSDDTRLSATLKRIIHDPTRELVRIDASAVNW